MLKVSSSKISKAVYSYEIGEELNKASNIIVIAASVENINIGGLNTNGLLLQMKCVQAEKAVTSLP